MHSSLKKRFLKPLPLTCTFSWADHKPGTPLLYLADCYYAWRRPSPGVTPAESKTMPFAERRILEGRIRKRRNTARYFKALMQSLRAGNPEPPLPKLGHAPAERRIAEVRRNIIEIYGQ